MEYLVSCTRNQFIFSLEHSENLFFNVYVRTKLSTVPAIRTNSKPYVCAVCWAVSGTWAYASFSTKTHFRGTFIISLFILLSTVGSCQWIYLNSIRIPFYSTIHKIHIRIVHIFAYYKALDCKYSSFIYMRYVLCTRHRNNQTSQQTLSIWYHSLLRIKKILSK